MEVADTQLAEFGGLFRCDVILFGEKSVKEGSSLSIDSISFGGSEISDVRGLESAVRGAKFRIVFGDRELSAWLSLANPSRAF